MAARGTAARAFRQTLADPSLRKLRQDLIGLLLGIRCVALASPSRIYLPGPLAQRQCLWVGGCFASECWLVRRKGDGQVSRALIPIGECGSSLAK